MARRRRNLASIRGSQKSPLSRSGDPQASMINVQPQLSAAATAVPLSSSAGRSPQAPPRPGNSVFALGSAMARLTGTFLRSRRSPSIPRLRLLGRNRVEYPRPINARHQQSTPATANSSPVSSPRRRPPRSLARRQQLLSAGTPRESRRSPQTALRDLVDGRRSINLRGKPPSAAADESRPFSSFILWIDLNQRGILHWLVCACALETPSIPNSDDPEVRAILYQMINLEGELGRLLGKLELFKKLDEYSKQQFMSDLIKRSRNQTNDSSEDMGPSEGVINVNLAVEQQGPLTSNRTSNETENVGPSEGVSDVQAVQKQQPLISDPTNDDSELIVSADQDSGESSALRFRYGEPFPLDVENESVTVTGRQMHLEPPREPSPLFLEYKDRRASLELHRDDSGSLFIVRRIRVEQIWMELHETAPSGFNDPPSYVNVPPEPEPEPKPEPEPEPEPSAAAGSYRCGEPFPNNVRYETATVTTHRVHREAAVAGQFLLFVEARSTEPFTDTFPAGDNYVTSYQIRVQRLLLEFPRELNQNQTDYLIRQAIAMTGRNLRTNDANDSFF
ncbi:hypothetical protein L6164_029039 [Bauhinia variegata]|uniref:Uncharacterized protein n=1 Tax=Bauhinia variegata TaxID=167791 RepID=A0ACB9L802_BAUVA|nr:hypothetical protein L6164_029039 [Bauhinia variegata]